MKKYFCRLSAMVGFVSGKFGKKVLLFATAFLIGAVFLFSASPIEAVDALVNSPVPGNLAIHVNLEGGTLSGETIGFRIYPSENSGDPLFSLFVPITGSSGSLTSIMQASYPNYDYAVAEWSMPFGWGPTGSPYCQIGSTNTGILASNNTTVLHVEIVSGQVTTCYFNIKRISDPPPPSGKGKLVVRKETIPVTAGESFGYTISPVVVPPIPNILTGQDGKGSTPAQDLDVGTYSLNEIQKSGWTIESASCSVSGGASTATSTGSVTIVSGETTTCTFINKKTGFLKIKKVASNAPSYPLPFSFIISKSDYLSAYSVLATNPATFSGADELLPGSYNIEESLELNSGWTFHGASCNVVGAPQPVQTTNGLNGVPIIAGMTTECTFYNDYAAPSGKGHLKIRKNILPLYNLHGESGVFKYAVTKNNSTSGVVAGASADNPADFEYPIELTSGQYTIEEIEGNGRWTLVHAFCDVIGSSNEPSVNLSGQSVQNVTIETGKTTECDLYNFYLSTSGNTGIVIIKDIIGGLPSGLGQTVYFNYLITDSLYGGMNSSVGVHNGISGASYFTPVNNPGIYQVHEYRLGNWMSAGTPFCRKPDGSSTGNSVTPSDPNYISSVSGVEVNQGETIVCTFKNKYGVPPPPSGKGKLVVRKETIPVTAGESFGYTISPAAVPIPNILTGQDGKGLTPDQDLDVGTYSLNEIQKPGWMIESASCSVSGGAATNTGSVTIVSGETTTCTFINKKTGTSSNGTLTIEKYTTGGGPDGAIFEYEIFSHPPLLPATLDVDVVMGSNGNGYGKDSTILSSEEYFVYENYLDGWRPVSASCDTGIPADDGAGVGYVQISSGEETTCTFENEFTGEEEPGSLTIEKYTTGGGVEVGDEFYFEVFKADTVEIIPVTVSISEVDENGNGNGSSLVVGLDPGEMYFVYEFDHDDWNPTSAVCDDTGTPSEDSGMVSYVQISSGEETTCTFENEFTGEEEEQGLVVAKKTVGGDDTFTFYRSGAGNFEITTDGGHGKTNLIPIAAETVVNIAELESELPDGWEFDSVYCEDEDFNPVFFDEQEGNPMSISFTLGEGTTTCTFTNNFAEEGSLTIEKNVEQIDFENCGPLGANCPDENSTIFTYWVIPSSDPVAAEQVEVEIEYDDNGIGYGSATLDGLDPEEVYEVYEEELDGWESLDYPTCYLQDESETGTQIENYIGVEDVEIDETTCTFENKWITEEDTVSIVIEKKASGEDSGELVFNYLIVPSEFLSEPFGVEVIISDFDETGVGSGSATLDGLDPGETYAVYEEELDGWESVGDPYCFQGGTAPVGWSSEDYTGVEGVEFGTTENVTCYFENKAAETEGLLIIKHTTGGNSTFNFSVAPSSSSGDGSNVTVPLNPDFVGGGTGGGGSASAGISTINGYGEKLIPISPGLYDISESVPPEWTLEDAMCDREFESEENGVSGVAVISGEITICTFGNKTETDDGGESDGSGDDNIPCNDCWDLR